LKKPDLGQTLGILANVGVIAGIVFPGIEIRASNTQAMIATTIAVSDQLATWKEFVAANGELSEIYASGMSDLGQLSPRERTQFDLMMKASINRFSGALLARGSALLGVASDDLESRVLEGEILHMLNQPGFQQWWSTTDRLGMPANMVVLINSLDALRKNR
jgi:hypothetical protein